MAKQHMTNPRSRRELEHRNRRFFKSVEREERDAQRRVDRFIWDEDDVTWDTQPNEHLDGQVTE